MNQLKSITYINSASIPFATAQLDGNTLMVGTNGAGKTTVLRSALYFYGVHEDSALGINIRKKKGFREYYFSEINSFIGFRYSNAYGNILVIAYRTGNTGVKFKFIMEKEPIDDKELFLDGRIARSPDALWKKLRASEFEVSGVVTTLSEYRDILYGQAGIAFKKYAFFDTKEDHNSFVHVLSNVFINSKLDASSIQKTISNTIPGFEPIDLEQIERSISNFGGTYEDVTKFEKNRGTVEDILRSLVQYDSFESQSVIKMDQLISNQKASQEGSLELEMKIEQEEKALQALRTEFEAQENVADEDQRDLNDAIVVLRARIKESGRRLQEYIKLEIEKKVALHLNKADLEIEKKSLQQQYDDLTNTQKSIKEKFEKVRESQKHSLEQQLQELDRYLLDIRSAFQEQQTKSSVEEREKIELLEADASKEMTDTAAALEDARQFRERAYEEKVKQANRPFLQTELMEAQRKKESDQRRYEESATLIETLTRSAESINALIGSIERERELALQTLALPFENTLEKYHERLRRLDDLLDVDTETFLGFVREMGHPNESLITSVLKDEVLLDKKLEPSFSNSSDSFFGFTINSDQLGVSEYSQQHIEEKKESVESEIATLHKQFKDDKEELENRFRNRLNEQRRLHRQKRKQLTELEIELPRLKNSWSQSDEEHQELLGRAKSEQESAVAKSEASYEKTLVALRKAEDAVMQARSALKGRKHEVIEQFKAKGSSLKKAYQIDMEGFEAKKVDRQSTYAKKAEAIDSDELEALSNDGVDSRLLQSLTERLKAVGKKLREIEENTALVVTYRHDKKEYFDGLEDEKVSLKAQQEAYKVRKQRLKELAQEHAAQKEHILRKIRIDEEERKSLLDDMGQMERHLRENSLFSEKISSRQGELLEPTQEKLQDILNNINVLEQQGTQVVDDIRSKQDLLYLDISPSNSLELSVRISSDRERVIKTANELKLFMDEGKIEQFKEEVANLFSLTINQLSKQTESLLEARQEVGKIVGKIRSMLHDLEGISVIDSIDLRTEKSSNKILSKLEQLRHLNDEEALSIEKDLFNFDKPQHAGYAKAVQIIRELRKELTRSNKSVLLLDDTYELEIRASENGHDTGWQVSLDEVGSNGTDVMIKTIVNIAMLAISLGIKGKQREEDKTYFHCILDEIGVLHPTYLKELMSFANKKQIRFLNGAPNRQLVSSFKRIYILTNAYQKTMLRPLLSKA